MSPPASSDNADCADPAGSGSAQGGFRTTRWTVVLQAQFGESSEALATLCLTYWEPLYAYARRRGSSPHDAEDLTQEFFSRLLEKHYLRAVRKETGPFRAFLLTAFKRFLANERTSERRLKRGGGRRLLSLNSRIAERLHADESGRQASDEGLYDRVWALTLLERVLHKLRDEFAVASRFEEFQALKPCLMAARGNVDYADVAERLGTSPGATRVAVHRLRKRFRELFRQEVSQTVLTSGQLEDELRCLMEALSAR